MDIITAQGFNEATAFLAYEVDRPTRGCFDSVSLMWGICPSGLAPRSAEYLDCARHTIQIFSDSESE
jgi:hypothetical protein